MPLSPRTQAFMQPPPTGEDARLAFEEGFTQMANNVLNSKFPDLVSQVTTFKVLSSDIDEGSGVGAFILSRNGLTVHVPVVLAGNKIKPIEIMYVKDKDIYLPLQRPWLDELDRGNLDTLGNGVKPPETLPTNIDIRTLVIPPNTGRFSYASAPGSVLIDFLTRAPNYTKHAFRRVLETNRPVLKFAVAQFDRKALFEALRPNTVKVAEAPTVAVLTPNDSAETFRSAFGSKAGEAFKLAAQQGFVVADERPFAKVAVQTEEALWLHTAESNGFYRLELRDGGTIDAMVIPHPQEFESHVRNAKRTSMEALPNPYWETRVPLRSETGSGLSFTPARGTRALILTEDGKIYRCSSAPVGKMLSEVDVSPKLLALLNGDTIANGATGLFVRYEAQKASATEPVSVRQVMTDSRGVRRISTDNIVGAHTLITDPSSAGRAIVAPKGSGIAYVPPTYKFVRGTLEYDHPFVYPTRKLMSYQEMLRKTGAAKVTVSDASAGMFSINGNSAQTKLAALDLLIRAVGLRGPDAASLLETAARAKVASAYVLSPRQLAAFLVSVKIAQDPTLMQQGTPPPPGMPPPEGMPPAMMPPEGGLPPEMMMGGMPPAMPPPPDPVAQAASEIGSQLATQAAGVAQQLAEQQKVLSDRLTILNAVQQRAAQIASEQAGLPPEEPVGPPPLPGAMPPEAIGLQGAPAPMSPEQEMAAGDALAQQAAPPMEEAAALQDPEAFEATAIGALAENPDLRSTVAMYVPALEQALNNLGKILLSLWVEESQYRSALGEKDYAELEERLRNVFSNLGTLVLRINQTAMMSKEDETGTQP